MSERSGRRRWLLGLTVVAVGLLGCAWKYEAHRRYRRALAEIQGQIESGLHATAARRLVALLAGTPDSDEALYLLGTCEVVRGRTRAADDAWARVPPGSPFAPRAILGRLQLRVERGQLAEAEQLLIGVLKDPRIDAASLPILLAPVYCQQGRLEETLRLIEMRWDALNRKGEGRSESALNLVRAYIELRRRPFPVDEAREALDQAARLAPEDDRVWLGKAHLAIRVGAYEEAAQWLEACLKRRPDDPPVWRTRLDWAVATNRVAAAREALSHLPAAEATAAQVARLAAWLAARRGDPEAEGRALERLVAADPADFDALDRLAQLATRAGHSDLAAELRGGKAEIDRLQARYEKLFQRNQPRRDSGEMARLARQLGRWFEARAYLTVALAVDPDRDSLCNDLVRVNNREPRPDSTARTLAEVLARELGGESQAGPDSNRPSTVRGSATAPSSTAGGLGRPEVKGPTG